MKKDITKKREKSQKMAGRSLRNDEIADLLDQPLPDSDSDDGSSDEEGDVGPDKHPRPSPLYRRHGHL